MIIFVYYIIIIIILLIIIWQCPQEGCSKCFTTAYNLKSHIKAHFKPDTHLCRYEGCDKAFPTAHKLKVHERRHENENKVYRCEMEGCDKVFSAHGTLKAHMKTHSGHKPHLCPVVGCEKRFSKASKLKLHLRSHTGERPYHCDVEVQCYLLHVCLCYMHENISSLVKCSPREPWLCKLYYIMSMIILIMYQRVYHHPEIIMTFETILEWKGIEINICNDVNCEFT